MTSIDERCTSHEKQIERLDREHAGGERRANRISIFRLITFIGAAVCLSIALSQGRPAWLLPGIVLGAAFFAGVVLHARTLSAMHALRVRRGVHERQLLRLKGAFAELKTAATASLPPEHPYASDIDLAGNSSLVQRIDVSQTLEGEAALLRALSGPSPLTLIRERQIAVEELFRLETFREDLETQGALHQKRGEKIDHRGFMQLFTLPSVFEARPWLRPTMFGMVTVTLSVCALAALGVIPSSFVWLCAFVQGVLLWTLREPVHAALDLVTARLGFAQAYTGLFQLVERQAFDAPHLTRLKAALSADGQSASAQLARLSRYEGFAQLRTQGPLYIVLNVLTLWDLFCLERIERFARTVGPTCERWFLTLGDVEMLCSFATLRHTDPNTAYPELREGPGALSVRGLAHPLLYTYTRVKNDVEVPGPGSLLIVTGSNMAGKSTLLRALGLNVALALSGAPVCADAMVLPVLRLRASMRIDDSLQRGASYFHAELARLRTVVSELEQGPPVLFLLDELLRGTNAHARHQGARAVILHLLRRGAMGVVATHDIALSELTEELNGQAHNVHFTDVFENGEMRFDYKLREGVVQTSNALRLLRMAGIDVEVDTSLG